MRLPYARYLPLLMGVCVVPPLVVGVVKSHYDLQLQTDRARVSAQLEPVAVQLAGTLNRGLMLLQTAMRREAGPQPDDATWTYWRLEGDTLLAGAGTASGPRRAAATVPAQTLTAALATHGDAAADTVRMLGPFALTGGGNGVVIAARTSAAAPAQWQGMTARLSDLVGVPGIDGFVRDGNQLHIRDADSGAAIYATSQGTLPAAAQRSIVLGASRWVLLAAPRGGWNVPVAHVIVSVFVILATITWLSTEIRRGTQFDDIAEELRQAETRRREANALYGQSLQSIAELEARLDVVSMYDSTTGLANRTSLIRRIDTVLDGMRRGQRGTLGVLAVGFEQFRHISTSFGAEFAGRLLGLTAERLQQTLPAPDLLFRVSDFQLAVILAADAAGGSVRLAHDLVEALQAPLTLDGQNFFLHPRIGLVEADSGYQFAEALFDHSLTALNLVTRDTPGHVCSFDASTVEASVSRLQLEADLERAFQEDQFELEYEPIVLSAAQRLMGFEALVRWNHPLEGRIAPGRFVPIIEQAGMSHRLNQWVLRNGAAQAALWRRAGQDDFFINVNLTSSAFHRPTLAEEIGELLLDAELDGRYLQVELTESALIEDLRAAARNVQRLNELGVSTWLDDFGTGYSSLSYLRTLSLKGVKIDRSFVARTGADPRDFGFLKSLIDLISYLGMETLVEGIETSAQNELARLTGCSYSQGYFFSKSLPADRASEWIRSDRSLTARLSGG